MKKYKVMVAKHGHAIVEAETESEALELIDDMDDREFNWDDNEWQTIEELD